MTDERGAPGDRPETEGDAMRGREERSRGGASDAPSAPVFAVVGRANKGKSSIIATLAEDDRIEISPIPGTTRRCEAFPVSLDGRTLFTLVDTPGFEQAPAVLHWLEATSPPSDRRRERVREFVATFEGSGDFVEERELLGPILEGAAILYVVDGARPYRDNHRAEMEILRWTGRPSMALVNRIGEGDHAAAWRSALEQYFKVVRDFDAHEATFEERIRLLRTFRELDEAWRAPLGEAIRALGRERRRRRSEVIDIITGLLVDALTFTLRSAEGELESPAKLEALFHQRLRDMERTAHRKVEVLYQHEAVDWGYEGELERPVFGEDLFAEKTWSTLGLTMRQLLAAYTLSGAAAGGILDAMVGGLSFGTGALLGGAAGAGAALLQVGDRFAKATTAEGIAGRLGRALSGGEAYRIGPFAHRNFPFILLDRALLHYDSVRSRAHARNALAEEAPKLAEDGRLAGSMAEEERRALGKLFDRVRKSHKAVPSHLRQELHGRVGRLVAGLDEGLDGEGEAALPG